MVRYHIRQLLSAVVIFQLSAISLWSTDTTSIDLIIRSTTTPAAPSVVGSYVIFTYTTDKPTRYVGARFKHEDFRILHLYSVNHHGIFILPYPVPENIQTLYYRIVTDGLMGIDPYNPDFIVTTSGIDFSVVTIERQIKKAPANPTIQSDGRITLSLKTTSGESVYVAGDFNQWDPFLHRLHETKPGMYTISLNMLPGHHYYTFIINGTRVLDPHNFSVVTDAYGKTVSTFYLPQ